MIYGVNGTPLTSAYGVSGAALASAYDVSGNAVFAGGETDYSSYTATVYKTIANTPTQGMEIYADKLFQFHNDDAVSVFNLADSSTITSKMTIESGHGNAVAFGNTFYAQTDAFPIIYCGDWYDPIVHVNRITTTSATHLYDIVYDQTKAGYHSNPCIDFANQIMYTVGYFLNDTATSTGNHCIVCKWDLSDMVDNGDGTFTPAFVSSYTRDFIYVMQDLKFNDGLCWIASGGTNTAQYVYGMNPDTGVFAHTVQMPITTEIEGLVWAVDNQTGLYFAYVGFQGGTYYKVTFAAQ